jgi:hypothetical protein
MMAELPGQGKFHEVADAEAEAIVEAASHQILPNEALCRVIRNMYARIQQLEAERIDVKLSVSP